MAMSSDPLKDAYLETSDCLSTNIKLHRILIVRMAYVSELIKQKLQAEGDANRISEEHVHVIRPEKRIPLQKASSEGERLFELLPGYQSKLQHETTRAYLNFVFPPAWGRVQEKKLAEATSSGAQSFAPYEELAPFTREQCLAKWYSEKLEEQHKKRKSTKTKSSEGEVMRIVDSSDGPPNWEQVSSTSGMSPMQCASLYVKGTGSSIKASWTKDQDTKLHAAVQQYGENWTLVSAQVPGRTPGQCLQRETRIIAPLISSSFNMGPWSESETELLSEAFAYAPNNWSRISKIVGTRTDRQCRERYTNVIATRDFMWSPVRDSILMNGVQASGKIIPWSDIASRIGSGVTDKQCRRRYKTLVGRDT